MKQDFDFIVAGLGGLGSAATYWLSRRNSNVLGLEQFELGHVRGESQDHSRIIRLSYHTPGYVRLAQQAYKAWSELEADSGEKLIVKTGGLDLWPPDALIPMKDYTGSLSDCQIPYEIMEADEIMRRFPQFRLNQDVIGLYQADGGIAPAAKANAAHQRMALQHGAVLRDRTPITSIRPVNGEFEVITPETIYRCGKLILAGGPWSNQLLSHFEMKLPLTITQEQVIYFKPNSITEFGPERFPVWIWMDEPCFYGFPVYGEAAIKVGQDVGGKEVTAETRSFDADEDALQRVKDFVRKHLPSGIDDVLYTKSCLYTLTPDRDFVIDSIADLPNCLITIGAGHAFKFACLIGKILSELAIDGATRSDIGPFKINRPILLEKNPAKHFMT